MSLLQKICLAGSLGLNLLLAGAVFMPWPKTLPPKEVAKPEADKQPQAAAKTQLKPFDWSQVDSPDFVTFVKNLRGIGCPEATIRDIVSGELKEIYNQSHLQITQESTSGSQEPTMPKSASPATQAKRKNSQSALDQLQAEEAELLAALLAPPVPLQAGSNTVVSQRGLMTTGPEAAAKQDNGSGTTEIPAAFLVGNADGQKAHLQELPAAVSDPELDMGTAQILNQMRSRFADAVQTVQADPASPEYLEQWRKARRDSDEYFSSMYGGDAFIQIQIQANRDAALAGSSSK